MDVSVANTEVLQHRACAKPPTAPKATDEAPSRPGSDGRGRPRRPSAPERASGRDRSSGAAGGHRAAGRPAGSRPPRRSVRHRSAPAGPRRSIRTRRAHRNRTSGPAGRCCRRVAAGVVGAVAESALSSGTPAKPVASGEIVPDDGQWVAVASAEDVAAGNVRRFATASSVGFVTARGDAVSAVSGSCTHQGCLLQLNEAAGRLDCPCHRTAVAFDGTVLFNQLETPPAPLPEIQVRSRDGNIEAFLPRQA